MTHPWKKVMDVNPIFWFGGPWSPPPQYPSPSAPPQTKRVPFCSFWNSASICILINTWNYNAAELWDKNWDTDAHAHVTYQAPITGLHSPTLLVFLQNSTDYLMLAQSCKFGVNCCFIGLTHPAACTECECLWLLEITTDPPFYLIYSKWVPIDWAWAEDFKYIIIISGKCPSKILEGGSQKVETPPTPPPPPDLLQLNSFIYQSIALNLRIPTIK